MSFNNISQNDALRGSVSSLYTYDPVTEAIEAPSGLGSVRNSTCLSLALLGHGLESQMDVDGAAAAQMTQILAIGGKESLVLMLHDSTNKDMFQVSYSAKPFQPLFFDPPFSPPLPFATHLLFSFRTWQLQL